jgi:preprotein translocase subunit SecG
LIIAILLQPRSQGGLGAAFGGGYADTLFGGRGGMEFLTKLTAILSAIFVVLIVGINIYLSTPRAHKSIMERETTQTVPVQPATPAGGGQGASQGQ